MDKLLIEATEDTPMIHFDDESNMFEISGRSYPDNVFTFYDPIFAWLNNYANAPQKLSTLVLKLDYFNTASAKIIFDILSVFDKMHANGHKVEILWFYKTEDDEMKDAGEGFKKIIDATIEIKNY